MLESKFKKGDILKSLDSNMVQPLYVVNVYYDESAEQIVYSIKADVLGDETSQTLSSIIDPYYYSVKHKRMETIGKLLNP